MHANSLSENLKGRYLDVGAKIIVECILGKLCGKVWTGVETSGSG